MGDVRVSAVIVVLVALSACAPPATGGFVSTPVPTLTVSCDSGQAVISEAECVEYQVDARMQSNNAYRNRMPLTDDQTAALEQPVADFTASVSALDAQGTLTPGAVEQALEDTGMLDATATQQPDGVFFHAYGPLGGCVSGSTSGGDVSLEIAGVLMDGGCQVAQW